MLEMMLGGKHKVTGVRYEDFLTWMNQNSSKITELQAGVSPGVKSGYVKVKITSYTSVMWGSPYKTYYTYDSAASRIAQHAVPNITVANELAANQRYVLFKTNYVGSRGAYQGVARNGYTSPSYTTYNGAYCDDAIYYDATLGIVMRYNPLTDSTPVPFDLTISA